MKWNKKFEESVRSDIEFELMEAKSYMLKSGLENSGLGKYEEFDIDAEPTPQTSKEMNDVVEFMETWFDNIEAQGYTEVQRKETEAPEQTMKKSAVL